MISPELLRRYNFFSGLTEAQLKQIAMISDEEAIQKGYTIFKEHDQATILYILLNGSVDLFFRSEEEFHPQTHKELFAGEINSGEVFGISSLVEPNLFSASARAAQDCRVVKIDAVALRKLIKEDPTLGCPLMLQTAKTLRNRLDAVRIQLAAAWAS